MGLIHVVLLVHAARCLDFGFQLVSFDVQLIDNENQKGKNSINLRAWDLPKPSEQLNSDQLEDIEMKVPQKSTTEADTDCDYRYPEMTQVDFILTNMKNELMQVSVKANEFLTSRIVHKTGKLPNAAEIRQALEARFRVLQKKQQGLFQEIFSNMTEDYRAFYTSRAKPLLHPGNDACKQQHEVKQLWQDLIERSLVTLRDAIRHCVNEYLHDQTIQPNSKLGAKVSEYFNQEITQIRSNQLKVLCDKFQLCYEELLKGFKWKTDFLSDSFWSSDL